MRIWAKFPAVLMAVALLATLLAVPGAAARMPRFEQKLFRSKTFWGSVLRQPVRISNVREADISHNSVTFSWDTDLPADSWVYVPTKEQAVTSKGNGDLTQTHRVMLTGLELGRTYTAELYSATDTWESSVMVEFTTHSLVISDIQTRDLTSTSATVVWKTNLPARSWVVFPPDLFGAQRVYGSSEETMDHRVKVDNLEPGREYVVVVRSGAAIHPAIDVLYSFTTAGYAGSPPVETPPPPSDPPVPPSDPPATPPRSPEPPPPLEALVISDPKVKDIAESSAVLEWTTNRPSNSWVKVDVSGAVSGQNESKYDHRVALYGLTPGYTYSVQLRSGDGNSVTTQTVTFTTKHGAWEPLRVLNPTVTDITDTNATITWHTNLPANSWVHAGLRIRQGPVFGVNDSVTDHRVTLTGLAPGQTYVAEVRSGNGKDIATSIVTFTTAATAPSTLTITSAEKLNVTATQATFVWTTSAPSDSWVQIRGQSGAPVGQAESVLRHEVTVTGLNPGQIYTADLRSNGGGHTASVAIPFKTNDMAPITIVQATPTNVTDTTATIVWNTNYPGNSWVQIPPGEGGRTFGLNDHTEVHRVNLTGLAPSTNYTAELRSHNSTGVARTIVHFRTNALGNHIPNGVAILGAQVTKTTQTTATIRWKTTGAANSWIKMDHGVFGRNDNTEDHEVIVTGLKSGQTYTAEVRSRGGIGEAASLLVTFQTIPESLTISDFYVIDITRDGAVVIWTTNRPANSWVHVPPRSLGGPAFGQNESVTQHKVEVKGLPSGTIQTAEIRSRDDTGEVTSMIITFPTR